MCVAGELLAAYRVLASYHRPPSSGRQLRLSTPPGTSRLVLAAWSTSRVRVAAATYYWPSATGRLLPRREPRPALWGPNELMK